jgi:hypothetical protein
VAAIWLWSPAMLADLPMPGYGLLTFTVGLGGYFNHGTR